MPAISIDTFFACSLLVSVVIIATAFTVGNMQTKIENMQNMNQLEYLQNIADEFVLNKGNPPDWGSQGIIPSSLGFACADSENQFDLDIDKITRLNEENQYSLTYFEIFKAIFLLLSSRKSFLCSAI